MGRSLITVEVYRDGEVRYTRTMKTLTARSMCRWMSGRIKLTTNGNEEFGVYHGAAAVGRCFVTLDRQYRQGEQDDGVREVTYDQIEKVYVPGQRAPKE